MQKIGIMVILLLCVVGCSVARLTKRLDYDYSLSTCDKLANAPQKAPRYDSATRIIIALPPPTISGKPPVALEGTWLLEGQYHQQNEIPLELLEVYRESVQFGNRSYAGSDGCNQVWGEYAWDVISRLKR